MSSHRRVVSSLSLSLSRLYIYIYIYIYVKLYNRLDAGLLKTLKQLRLYTKMSRCFDQQLRSSSIEMY